MKKIRSLVSTLLILNAQLIFTEPNKSIAQSIVYLDDMLSQKSLSEDKFLGLLISIDYHLGNAQEYLQDMLDFAEDIANLEARRQYTTVINSAINQLNQAGPWSHLAAEIFLVCKAIKPDLKSIWEEVTESLDIIERSLDLADYSYERLLNII